MDKLKGVAKLWLTREPSRHTLFVICSSNLVENDRMDLLKMDLVDVQQLHWQTDIWGGI